jgi:voltage-gated potassium channel
MALVLFLRRLMAQKALWGAAAVTAVLVSSAGLAVWLVEPQEFDSPFSGIWWAGATVTTVGYGDFAPHSAAGRGVGFVLMFSGAALFAVVTAVVASALVLREVEVEEHALESKEDEIIALLEVVDARLGRLEQVDDESPGADGSSRNTG